MDLAPFHGPPAAAPHVPGFVARTLLGFGTHGEVWLADDLATGGSVALKIGRRASAEPAGASGDPPHPESEQETALLCRIDHPHIVRLQRVVPLPSGGLAMVLDLASGGSLASLVAARGRFEPGEVTTLLVPLADALDHLHRRGLSHGDVAPGNVLFTGEGRPQLGDLGVARVLGTRIGEAWATPGFTDPALTGADLGEIDPRAVDLWGLAAVGWFALTGRPPEPVPAGAAPGSESPPALAEFLTHCLTAAPQDRPSLTELADRVWQAAHPAPVRLVTARDPEGDGTGLPPLSNRVTRRVPMIGTASPGPGEEVAPEAMGGSLDDGGRPQGAATRDGPRIGGAGPDPGPARARESGGPRARGWAARVGRFRGPAARGPAPDPPTPRRRGVGVATAFAVAAVVSAVVAAITVRSDASPGAGRVASLTSVRAPGPSPATGSSATGSVAGSAAPSSVAPGSTDPGAPAVTDLEAELSQALITIGRARAVAFGRASERFLAQADVTGSPAYTDDLHIVQRLRARGYRLEGVRYEIAEVRVLHRRGELVDVRAVVTTSAHRQVQVSSGAGISVPADGPRSVVLTVAPIDRNLIGPTRWRVRSVQVAS